MPEPMSALDAEFLHLEDGVNHLHIGSCAVFEGPTPSPAEAEALYHAALPGIEIALGVRVTVAIMSYDGGLYFGVTGDRDTARDVEVLAEGIEAGMAELVALAG